MPQLAEIVQPADYPPVLRQPALGEFLRVLWGDETQRRMTKVLVSRRTEFTQAVQTSVQRLQAAALASDFDAVYAEAHEIRGLAQTGGLNACGAIADRLCHYLQIVRPQNAADAGLVGLHAGAIARAASADDEVTKLGTAVAEELGALTARKLAAFRARHR